MRLEVLFLALSTLVAAAPTLTKRADPIQDGSAVNGQTFDYVIAGGGLAGVVLASRLTEATDKTVLVIEAGFDESNNVNVTDAGKYQAAFNTRLDWAYKTVNQTSGNGRQEQIRAGRALGGSTTINGMAWSKPHDFQLDALEAVGNAGLNWATLQPYMQRAEAFKTPSAEQIAAGLTFNPSCRGTDGPIAVKHNFDGIPSDLEHNFNQTGIDTLHMPYPGDLTCGNPAGLTPISHTSVDGVRSDAYKGYLFGKDRPNLTILVGSEVGKVVLSSDATPRATGVEFRDSTGKAFTVNAKNEVLMALGSIKTPLILQQSGIGPADVLQAAGVQQRVDLPVGHNLIDQVTASTWFHFSGKRGGGQPLTWPRFQDLFSGDETTKMTNLLQNNLEAYVQDAIANGAASSAEGLRKVLELQRDWILNKGAAASENFDYSYDTTLGYDSWFLLPFGRGSVKITNSDPYGEGYAIDPRIFANEFDRLASAASARFTRLFSEASPLVTQITDEDVPGNKTANDLASWETWATQNYRSNWHPIGTVPMMSKDLGGCVDSEHKVYGVDGLRVIDGSNIPFQVSSHLMSVLYGLSERAAELIANGGGNSTNPGNPGAGGQAIHHNGDATKCLEVLGGNFENGAAVAIATCDGSAKQKWTFAQGTTAVQVAGQNFCLDATDASPASGTKMKIWQCYAGLPAQTWTYANNELKLNSANQCLDLTDGGACDGNVMQVWECAPGNPNQIWTV